MQRWQKTLGMAALGLALSLPLTGCLARPAPRPEAGTELNVSGSVNPALSEGVAHAARAVGGAGTAEAVVVGNGALIAIQLNSSVPGGTEGLPLTGRSHDVGYPGSAPSGGPVYGHGPGGSPGTDQARPGGQITPSAPPGGTPNYTQAIPNATGNQATQNGSNTTPAPVPGAYGSQPMEVMTRIADQVRAKNPDIAEVRFATNPDDARRVAELARTMRSGTVNAEEVRTLWNRAIPAGTTEFSPQHPSPGSRG